MENIDFWKIIKEYNVLMSEAIKGPNCIDPTICKGDCCSIEIDVPKVLAEEYVKRKYAKKGDFIRSNIFSFKLRFDNDKRKCFLFDQQLNGCSVHQSGIKPPQCWIYPTKFSNPNDKDIKCKRSGGWQITDEIKAIKAEKLLEKYNFLCLLEAKKELRNINERLVNLSINDVNIENSIKDEIKNYKPSELGGFKDTWQKILPFSAEGFSLQMKNFCIKHNPNCKFLPDKFLECSVICDCITNKLIEFLKQTLYRYIRENEPDSDGKYPLYKLFNFESLKG
ncbi:MAG: hypothetical protein GF317_14950 [Candidatus Lokiarchaeota archaeon]|nr:hypothetical protein [Candidatus Lokiarchaeota archaeon]MBD3200890.1 hypothetical protein [Candidatus Lokiarchaeota archaeon]